MTKPFKLIAFRVFPFRTEELSGVMDVASLSQDLYEFAVELRQLAYTMPSGHEDPLVHLSERMVRCARERVAGELG